MTLFIPFLWLLGGWADDRLPWAGRELVAVSSPVPEEAPNKAKLSKVEDSVQSLTPITRAMGNLRYFAVKGSSAPKRGIY
jgi:hypothetical protein